MVLMLFLHSPPSSQAYQNWAGLVHLMIYVFIHDFRKVKASMKSLYNVMMTILQMLQYACQRDAIYQQVLQPLLSCITELDKPFALLFKHNATSCASKVDIGTKIISFSSVGSFGRLLLSVSKIVIKERGRADNKREMNE